MAEEATTLCGDKPTTSNEPKVRFVHETADKVLTNVLEHFFSRRKIKKNDCGVWTTTTALLSLRNTHCWWRIKGKIMPSLQEPRSVKNSTSNEPKSSSTNEGTFGKVERETWTLMQNTRHQSLMARARHRLLRITVSCENIL